MDYVRIGPTFSNTVLQALFDLLKKQPPRKGRRLLIIATTSDPRFLEEAELLQAFNVCLSMPYLSQAVHFKCVLQQLPGYAPAVVDAICDQLNGRRVGIKKILSVAEMAVQQQNPTTTEIFLQCL